MTQPDAATRAQHAAADPGSSVWLSANAGSGKTKVLTDRVARHLLRGVDPERILCLTYTKAAASEMQNRLFARLGGWAMLPDPALRDALHALGVPDQDLTPSLISKARTLFARAIETPGGLKIQTIHSFCSGLLRRFPMEAGLPPQFRELDEPASRDLRKGVLADLASGPHRSALEDMAGIVAEPSFDGFLAEMTSHAEALRNPHAEDHLLRTLSLPPDTRPETLLGQVVVPGNLDLLGRLCDLLATGSKTDAKHAETLAALLQTPSNLSFLEGLEGIFLTGASSRKQPPFSAKIPGFPTNATRAKLGPEETTLDALMRRVEDTRDTRLALDLMDRTRVLLRFARAYLDQLEATKTALGVLDFDDLILQARALLTDREVAQWVLFRLDGGIDHVLVDEAQDTSPAQWDVIRLLTQEFTAGDGAGADRDRTIFVVGDPKQSIYSFQGADPKGFDRMRAYFGDALGQIGAPFGEHALLHSFRSSPGILGFVDQCFETTQHMGLGHRSEHRAFRSDLPGRVDLWPPVPKPDIPEKPPWYDPVDLEDPNDPKLELARKVAEQVDEILSSGTQITTTRGDTRPVQARDFLILVQSRSAMFHEIIRSCKDRGIPIAGADRLQVGAELAVKDLIACLSFLATPEDDLSLACVLKSPLFNWSENDLYTLAQPRGGQFLWAALRDAADRHPDTVRILQDLRDAADFMRPFEVLERILTRHNGRAKLLARLGHEAEDGIDALLAQALSYEFTNVPSLTGFLTWFLSDDLTIKRQMDSQRNEVRVMTVHGAKGLEAPIVILPDCGKTRDRTHQNTLLSIGDAQSTLRTSRAVAPRPCLTAIEAERQAADEERMRLFYVAMTRAESWLIIAAAGETGAGLDSWHAIAAAAMDNATPPPVPLLSPVGEGRRISFGVWPDQTEKHGAPASATRTPLVLPALKTPPTQPDPVSPSDLGGDKIVAGGGEGLDRDSAMARGTHIHLLLEHLPEMPRANWPEHADGLLRPWVADAQTRAAIFAEAEAVLTAPALVPLFAPDALAEVDITAHLPELSRQITGTIDRLIVTDHDVLAVDFKSNATVPATAAETPEGILRQMGAYQAALEQVYPDRVVTVAIIWTRTATRMDLPADLVRSALGNAVVTAGGS
ncbi:double-strand break repair helicase AddA [Tropicimonas sp. S265A]|uniref:double-strand break repair helicase AddA n=1 Tax=Tropicimonas sp. S265A TaxID=3415134 RepID=UPI003C7B52B0